MYITNVHSRGHIKVLTRIELAQQKSRGGCHDPVPLLPSLAELIVLIIYCFDQSLHQIQVPSKNGKNRRITQR